VEGPGTFKASLPQSLQPELARPPEFLPSPTGWFLRSVARQNKAHGSPTHGALENGEGPKRNSRFETTTGLLALNKNEMDSKDRKEQGSLPHRAAKQLLQKIDHPLFDAIASMIENAKHRSPGIDAMKS